MLRTHPTLMFRDSPSSTLASSATLATSYSWRPLSTTSPGIESLSGKFIRAVGVTILRRVEDAFVIRRRISYIQSLCPMFDDSPPEDVEMIYCDLLELARPNLYSDSIKSQALQILCEQLERGEARHLVEAFSKWNSEEGILIVREILQEFWRTVRVPVPQGLETVYSLHRQLSIPVPIESADRFRARLAYQPKVLLLGSGGSGKSTLLKNMRLRHGKPFSAAEIESYRQDIFNNLTHGLRYLLAAMRGMDLKVSPHNMQYLDLIANACDICDDERFPLEFYEPLRSLWSDPNAQKAWERRNEAALPENLFYFFSELDRLFNENYVPAEQDILQCRVRTVGVTETMFQFGNRELIMIDVSGQKAERRKWLHCFQDVTAIVFVADLSGYDQRLVGKKDENQMQDAMAFWDSICNSQWFKHASMILLLNKNDLFEKKIQHSDIKDFFPDYKGERGDIGDGHDYFVHRFVALAQRSVYAHITATTDTTTLPLLTNIVEE